MIKNHSETNRKIIKSARKTLKIESSAIKEISSRIGEEFASAILHILHCKGRIVITGIGKTGHIGRKISSTLASTGTSSFFMHAAEAMHGDLGMLTNEDILVTISYSGNGSELLSILPLAKRLGIKIISITGNEHSDLAKLSDIVLNIAVKQEACPMNLAPTASTTAALAIGDAIAIACLEQKGFKIEDFARYHPGGTLGRKLLTRVSDVMRPKEELPIVHPELPILDVLDVISLKKMGIAIVTKQDDSLAGIFTDGDLRRLLVSHKHKILDLRIEQVMNYNPHCISPECLATEAVRIMNEKQINHMLVLDNNKNLVGAIHLHDLMNEKVI